MNEAQKKVSLYISQHPACRFDGVCLFLAPDCLTRLLRASDFVIDADVECEIEDKKGGRKEWGRKKKRDATCRIQARRPVLRRVLF